MAEVQPFSAFSLVLEKQWLEILHLCIKFSLIRHLHKTSTYLIMRWYFEPSSVGWKHTSILGPDNIKLQDWNITKETVQFQLKMNLTQR